MDEPSGSRLFVVCGKNAEEDVLLHAFSPFGNVQNLKIIREKGVAYVKYDKASSAAMAIEQMHETVLNEGRGPKIKVILAESPNSRRGGTPRSPSPQELPLDPDNIPPRSRLFLVVPKSADAHLIESEMSKFPDLQYCKTDLIASKGIVFCKYAKASSALLALEATNETGTLAGYKVKCLLAEPKGKRSRGEQAGFGTESASRQYGRQDYNHLLRDTLSPSFSGLSGSSGSQLLATAGQMDFKGNGAMTSLPPALAAFGLGISDYGSMRNAVGALGALAGLGSVGGSGVLQGLHGLRSNSVPTPLSPAYDAVSPQGGFGALAGLNLNHLGSPVGLGSGMGLSGFSNLAGLVGVSTTGSPGTLPGHSSVSRQRLFVVVHKSVPEDQLARLFRMFPGMEYCDLKKDRTLGKSKGFCYVNYSTAEAAAAAVEQLNGIEFPPSSGHRIKVMFAEPLGTRMVTTSPPHDGLSHSADATPMSPAVEQRLASHLFQLADLGLQQAERSVREDPYGDAASEVADAVLNAVDQEDVLAVQTSLAHMSMPPQDSQPYTPRTGHYDSGGYDSGGGHYDGDPQGIGMHQTASAMQHTSEMDWNWPEMGSTDDPRLIYTVLSRPLPTYALQHMFGQYGLVELVHLFPADQRYGMVKFQDMEAAHNALQALNGTEVLGERLIVTRTDPVAAARNSKRARVSE